ncbi:hypothetical protein BVRB_9g213200 [Beta vulgaris subsp. vulgaris]|uniref:uncharacterized protein LOC104903858 isoform X1 n=1 Tax=Beta vulgaris subsp. vulgaris TaxID=3555 RepID=UPI00053FD798|nr:uncharacterized protein LOC104903858 isoform X1 [Beta vulgaris subsp. vulgaris]KMT01304.1 hypothetical protein BVRB_9g213200 [Beta vulgaris subsp. vulgaris]
MHAKSDSDVTSMATMSPPRSPSRSRAVYYVESPSFSQHDNLDKLSYATLSPNTSPTRQFQYHCSPIHHSRESSTSRLFSSSSLKHQYGRSSGWRRIYGGRRLGEERDCHGGEEDEEEDDDGGGGPSLRFYVGCFLVSFVVLFTVFSVILWGAAKSFHPHILVKNMVFLDFTIQAGLDGTGVPTDMLSLNSTVRMYYRNRATFFGVHVTSSPFQLYYYDLKVASGQMKKFYQKRRSHSNITTVVHGHQIPLYGGMSVVSNARAGNSLHTEKVNVGLNLTFTVRSRAYILGKLVKSKFYKHIRCPVTLHATRLGKPMNLLHSCVYE